MSERHITLDGARPERRRRHAQDRADAAYTLADEKVDAGGAATAAREVVVDWAEEGNLEPIPAPKLIERHRSAHEDIVNVLDGRLPRPAGQRCDLGWSQRRCTFIELSTSRPAIAADRRQHRRDERWPGRAAVPARSRF